MTILRLIYDYWCMALRMKYMQAHLALKQVEYQRAEMQFHLENFDQQAMRHACEESRNMRGVAQQNARVAN